MFTPRGTVKVAGYDENGKELMLGDYTCLSSDQKPTTGIANGSIALEMDTSTMYVFDQAGSQWRAWS